MSLIKNGYYEACENIASGVSSLAESFKSSADGVFIEAHNGRMETLAEYCLTYALRNPKGGPLKGDLLMLVCDIHKKALIDEDWESLNKLKNQGFIHN
jgi:hypothetical protein